MSLQPPSSGRSPPWAVTASPPGSSGRPIRSTATTRRPWRCSSPSRCGRRRGRSPAKIVAELASDHIASAEVAGPGFINLRVSARLVPAGSRARPRRGRRGTARVRPRRRSGCRSSTCSGNPTGPVTVGTARNAAYGDSLARLFAFAGHDVGREYYFNDAGRQIELFGASLKARAQGVEPPEDGYQGGLRRRGRRRARARRGRAGGGVGAGGHRGDDRPHIRDNPGALPVLVRHLVPRAVAVRGAARCERAIDRVRAAGHTYEQDGAMWLRSIRLRRRQGPRAGALDGSPPTSRATSPTSPTSSSAGSTPRCTCSAPTTTATSARLKAAAAGAGLRPRPGRRPDLPAGPPQGRQDVEAGGAASSRSTT